MGSRLDYEWGRALKPSGFFSASITSHAFSNNENL